MSKLDEIFKNLGTANETTGFITVHVVDPNSVAYVKKEVKALFLELIGEDETRAELRQKIGEL